MKKPIEEMFLYKLNYYVCRIFLTSLISNALFALVLGCLFTLGLVLSARVVYLIYFLMMYPSYYLSVHYLAEKKVCWRKGKIKRMCFIITLFQLFVIIFAVDWYLLVGKIGAWYLIPFLLCLLLFVSHSFFSTLIDIRKEDKADSLVYLIKRNIWLLSKNVKGFLWYLCLLYGLFWCIQHDFLLTALLYPGLPFVTVFCLKEKENDFK